MDLKSRILKAIIEHFDDYGIRFKMDDLSHQLGVSKRTIYEQVGNKEHIIELLIDEAFRSIKEQEFEIMADPSLSRIIKLKSILGIMPKLSGVLNYQKIYEIEHYYPKLFAKIEEHLDHGWDTTITLLEEAIHEGEIRDINPILFKEILFITMDTMLKDSFLLENHISYNEAVSFVIDVVFNGLLIQK